MLNKLREFTQGLQKEIYEKPLSVKEANDIYAQMRKEFIQATYVAGEFAFASHFVELLKAVKKQTSTALSKIDKISFSLCIGPHYNDEGYRVEVLTDYSYLRLYQGKLEISSTVVNNVFLDWAENVNISSIGRILPTPPNVDNEQFITVIVEDAQKLLLLLENEDIKANDVLSSFTKLRVYSHS